MAASCSWHKRLEAYIAGIEAAAETAKSEHTQPEEGPEGQALEQSAGAQTEDPFQGLVEPGPIDNYGLLVDKSTQLVDVGPSSSAQERLTPWEREMKTDQCALPPTLDS